MVILGLNFIMYSNGSVGNIIGCTVTSLVIELACQPFILSEDFKFETLSGAILNAITGFIISTVLCMLDTYIAYLKARIVKLMIENLNLLDKMHEGLIVVSKEDLGL